MKLSEFLGDKSYETYFDEKLKECKNMEELPRELNNCFCCSRHKQNFPILGTKLVARDTYKENYTRECECECKCPCRHIARHLCREWDTVHEVEDISETESEEESDVSLGSIEDFIERDAGMSKKTRKELDKALAMFTGKKSSRR
jgi:hypothetical protein